MYSIPDKKGLSLILISSVLLGIWATVNTIALRNILLVLGAIVAISYWIEWLRACQVKIKYVSWLKIFNWLPLLLICLMFIWVIIHYLFFSQFPEKQWDELTSTWLRSLLAAMIGSATGQALQRNRNLAWLLWFGLFISFLVLIYQYIPKVLAKHSLFATDFFGDYIYWAKFNGVLAGVILIAGLLGLSIDTLRAAITKTNPTQEPLEIVKKRKRYTSLFFLYSISGMLIPIYSFVFIFDAKNGVGVTGILLIIWLFIGGIYLLMNILMRDKSINSSISWGRWFVGYLLIVTVFAGFAILHAKNNPGWETLIEDMAIAADIETNQHWKNIAKMGYPKREDGQTVRGNTYERVAFGMAGAQVILHNPIGSGVFRGMPQQTKFSNVDFGGAVYTHCAWIDFGLAFGLLGLLLLPMCLIVILINAAVNQNLYYRASITSIGIGILVLYLVGEYGFQHGVEALFFIVALLSTLSWKIDTND